MSCECKCGKSFKMEYLLKNHIRMKNDEVHGQVGQYPSWFSNGQISDEKPKSDERKTSTQKETSDVKDSSDEIEHLTLNDKNENDDNWKKLDNINGAGAEKCKKEGYTEVNMETGELR